MNFLNAQRELAESIKVVSGKVKSYFWKLSGDDPNSLCKFLCIGEEDLKTVLRLCKIYIGSNDNFSKNNFENTMTLCGCDWTIFKLNGKAERFIRIGEQGGAAILPKMGMVIFPRILWKMNISGCCGPSPKKEYWRNLSMQAIRKRE
jgi:hypothetical protein